MSDTATPRASADERTKQIDALRTELIGAYTTRGDRVPWEVMRELIGSATQLAEEPWEHATIASQQARADRALERLQIAVKEIKGFRP